MKTASRIWLFGDYNQAESRVVAWKAPVPKLVQWYSEGVDVHSYVCQLIARVVQENKIATPRNPDTGKPLFYSKAWSEPWGKQDPERDPAKRCVHGYNYGIGPDKFALTAKISVELARTLLAIYGALFPEIKTGYQAWVEHSLKTTKTIWMPEPVRYRKVFHGVNQYAPLDDNTLRSGYSCYPQCTVGSMTKRAIAICSNIFKEDRDEIFKDQWCAWYGQDNWESWRALRARDDKSPLAILWSGMDIRLNVHDAGGISVPNDPWLVEWAARTWRLVAETPIHVSETSRLVIPVDFKIGTTWSNADLKDYKIAA